MRLVLSSSWLREDASLGAAQRSAPPITTLLSRLVLSFQRDVRLN